MKNNIRNISKFFALVFLLIASPLFSLDTSSYILEGHSFYLDLPLEFSLVEQTESRFSFSIKNSGAYFQIKSEAVNNRNIGSISNEVIARMGGKGEGSEYMYHSNPAWFGSFSFAFNNTPYTSYILVIQNNENAFIMISYAPDSLFDQFNDYLVSALDSFSLPMYADTFAGPIGAYDRYYSNENTQRAAIQTSNINIEAYVPFGYVESEQFLIDREARILNKNGTITGWKRFYRLLFKDMYQDIVPLAQAVFEEKTLTDNPVLLVEQLLSYVQGFSYSRTGTLSDIHPALYAVMNKTGDCDTRSILLLGLLHYFNIDGILLVSTVYMHGLAGIDIDYTGAGFMFENRKYIIAETTEKVGLGLIASDMADPANWIAVELWER